uniref:SET domain-containing protein n=1 Tax=Erpetoichthys calabaricus TaxID=27687 RepID=A0A8C4XFY4_ERPCA
MKLCNDIEKTSFCRRQPTLHHIKKRIAQQGWTNNIPSATKINEMWKPAGSMEDIPQDKYIQRYVSSQKWKGLVVCDDIPGKGRGVYTSRRFQKGEVVCDYHGENISRKEGELKMKNVEAGEMGYLYFCKNAKTGGLLHQRPDITLSKSPGYGNGPRDVVLFIAKKDIEANKELLFDYGVERKYSLSPWLSNKLSTH